MRITRKFTTAGSDPFASVSWVKRSSKISNPDGTVVFQMDDAEVPSTWSQLATDIMVSKYFRKAGIPQADGSTGPEKSARQVIHRLAGCWRFWGEAHGYFDSPDDAQAFYDELAYMLTHQLAAPNSPQWFNTGLNFAYGITGPAQGHYVVEPKTGEVHLAHDAYSHPQPHACFIQSIDDDLVNAGGIMDLWVREARLFKYGSGTGTNFSKLRGEAEKLSGGGKSSGLMSWLKIGDRAAGAIKSGGTTRRAAKMVCLDMDHPDIEQFINWKVREELKVAALVEGLKVLRDQRTGAADPETIGQTADRLGLKLDYDFNGEAYQTVSGQNSNNSVRIPDEFFEAVDADAPWATRFRLSGKVSDTYKSSKLWDDIAYAAWRCADPGVQYDTTINAWHTCPGAGRINASNPCVTADTLVATTTGYRRIGDLVGKSAEIIDARGQPAFVDSIFKTGVKPVFELRTRAGYALKLTADHKVFTLNRGDVPACELTVDDVVQLRGAGFGDDFLPEFAAELLGSAIGDGCITRGSDQDHLFVTLAHAEAPVAQRLAGHIQAAKDWLSTGDARSTRPTGVTSTPTTLRVGTSVQRLLDLFSTLAVLDEGSHLKRFRDAVFSLDRSSIAAILRGLFTTDGTVADYSDKSQYVALDSTSLDLLQQVQLLLLSFGIKAKLYRDRRAMALNASLPDGRGGHADYPVKQMHSLRITRSSRVEFQKHIGFMPESPKAARLAALNARVETYADRLVDTVASLTPAGTEDVFDLTEPRTHHFVAAGMVVHNCSEYMFLDNTACNLASINLIKFYDSQSRQFDVASYEHAIDLWTIVLEISVLMAAFPSREVAELSYKYRTLGLGYANLGAMLMQAGVAYDSEEGRALCAALTAILTGRAYRMSAEMAAALGSFPGFEPERDNMLRVIRNHRRAAQGVARESAAYEGLNAKTRPVPIDHALFSRGAASGSLKILNSAQLLAHAVEAWDDALELGEKFGYRNAQTTVIAPTGTIGLLMDCDTTGIEPDFALVKFKKLAGGGYFKIANASVKPALEALAYSDKQIREIMAYLLGALTVDVPLPGHPGSTLKSYLLGHGFTPDDIDRLNDALPGVFELSFAFTAWSIGDSVLKRLGVDPERAKSEPSFNVLREIGLSPAQIDELNDVICGHQTVEGAPHLRPEHLSVFDCANKCGKLGVRFIAPEGHIRMMAAAQPFISGAISKTINLPAEAGIADIKSAYRLSWELGLKANALYRDGCKLSQPLNSKADKQEDAKDSASGKAQSDSATLAAAAMASVEAAESDRTLEQLVDAAAPAIREVVKVVERPMRRRLPDTRASITHKFNIAGHEGYLTVGLYEDSMPGELFITMAKEGSTIGGLMDCVGTAVSVALQYGVPVESLVNKFTHQRFEPAGMTTNRDIPFAKSLVDYIFRWMGIQFIPGYREANTPRRDPEPLTPEQVKTREIAALAGHADGEHDGALPEASDRTSRITVQVTPTTSPTPGEPRGPFVDRGSGLGGPPASTLVAHKHVHVEARAGLTTIDIDTKFAASSGTAPAAVSALAVAMQSSGDGPPCEVCGTITVRNGTCYKCVNCGSGVGGCS